MSFNSPFFLTFVKGNISRCAGCGKDLRALDGKPHPPPADLCIQHKEFIFENPHTTVKQQSQEQRNVYYHAFRCVQTKCEHPRVIVQPDVKTKLSAVHIQHLMAEFGLQILNNTA